MGKLNCSTIYFLLWPVLAYWAMAIVVFVKLLENDIVVFKALGFSVVWPLALVDEIVRAITTYP